MINKYMKIWYQEVVVHPEYLEHQPIPTLLIPPPYQETEKFKTYVKAEVETEIQYIFCC
jgi:hypothetical protein